MLSHSSEEPSQHSHLKHAELLNFMRINETALKVTCSVGSVPEMALMTVIGSAIISVSMANAYFRESGIAKDSLEENSIEIDNEQIKSINLSINNELKELISLHIKEDTKITQEIYKINIEELEKVKIIIIKYDSIANFYIENQLSLKSENGSTLILDYLYQISVQLAKYYTVRRRLELDTNKITDVPILFLNTFFYALTYIEKLFDKFSDEPELNVKHKNNISLISLFLKMQSKNTREILLNKSLSASVHDEQVPLIFLLHVVLKISEEYKKSYENSNDLEDMILISVHDIIANEFNDDIISSLTALISRCIHHLQLTNKITLMQQFIVDIINEKIQLGIDGKYAEDLKKYDEVLKNYHNHCNVSSPAKFIDHHVSKQQQEYKDFITNVTSILGKNLSYKNKIIEYKKIVNRLPDFLQLNKSDILLQEQICIKLHDAVIHKKLPEDELVAVDKIITGMDNFFQRYSKIANYKYNTHILLNFSTLTLKFVDQYKDDSDLRILYLDKATEYIKKAVKFGIKNEDNDYYMDIKNKINYFSNTQLYSTTKLNVIGTNKITKKTKKSLPYKKRKVPHQSTLKTPVAKSMITSIHIPSTTEENHKKILINDNSINNTRTGASKNQLKINNKANLIEEPTIPDTNTKIPTTGIHETTQDKNLVDLKNIDIILHEVKHVRMLKNKISKIYNRMIAELNTMMKGKLAIEDHELVNIYKQIPDSQEITLLSDMLLQEKINQINAIQLFLNQKSENNLQDSLKKISFYNEIQKNIKIISEIINEITSAKIKTEEIINRICQNSTYIDNCQNESKLLLAEIDLSLIEAKTQLNKIQNTLNSVQDKYKLPCPVFEDILDATKNAINVLHTENINREKLQNEQNLKMEKTREIVFNNIPDGLMLLEFLNNLSMTLMSECYLHLKFKGSFVARARKSIKTFKVNDMDFLVQIDTDLNLELTHKILETYGFKYVPLVEKSIQVEEPSYYSYKKIFPYKGQAFEIEVPKRFRTGFELEITVALPHYRSNKFIPLASGIGYLTQEKPHGEHLQLTTNIFFVFEGNPEFDLAARSSQLYVRKPIPDYTAYSFHVCKYVDKYVEANSQDSPHASSTLAAEADRILENNYDCITADEAVTLMSANFAQALQCTGREPVSRTAIIMPYYLEIYEFTKHGLNRYNMDLAKKFFTAFYGNLIQFDLMLGQPIETVNLIAEQAASLLQQVLINQKFPSIDRKIINTYNRHKEIQYLLNMYATSAIMNHFSNTSRAISLSSQLTNHTVNRSMFFYESHLNKMTSCNNPTQMPTHTEMKKAREDDANYLPKTKPATTRPRFTLGAPILPQFNTEQEPKAYTITRKKW